MLGAVIPPDTNITPKDLQVYGETIPVGSDELLKQIANDTHILSSLITLDSGLIQFSASVGATPTLIIPAEKQFRGYWLINPSLVIGGTTATTGLLSGIRTTNGNTQSSPLGVANYRDMHLYLNVTAVSGAGATLDIYAQSLDPVSATWADTQLVFSAVSTTGLSYANIGSLGLGTDFALRWVLSGTTPSFTFSVGIILKEGLPGTGSGVGKAIYLGTNSNITTGAGFPLMEGNKEKFYLRPDTELWAVAPAATTLNIFSFGSIKGVNL